MGRSEQQGFERERAGDGLERGSGSNGNGSNGTNGDQATFQDVSWIRDLALTTPDLRLRRVGRRAFVQALESEARRVLGRRLSAAGEGAIADALEDLHHALVRVLEEHGRIVRGISKRRFLEELERSHHDLLRQREAARREIEALRGQARDLETRVREAQERNRVRMERERADVRVAVGVRVRARMQAAQPGPESEALIQLAIDAAVAERERALEEAFAEHRRDVQVLERRVAKLTRLLHVLEQTLAEVQRHERGLASGHRSVQGLAPDAYLADLKRQHLAAIFRENLGLRPRSA